MATDSRLLVRYARVIISGEDERYITKGSLKHMTSQDQNLFERLKQWQEISQSKAFIAADFLLWLWFYVETEQHPNDSNLSVQNQEYRVKLWIDDRLVLESDDSRAHVQSLRGGNPSRSIEAASALQTGKGVKELKLGFEIEPFGEFFCVINSKDLALRSIQIPQQASDGDSAPKSSLLAYRLQMTEILVEILDALFLKFISKRIEDVWWIETLPSIEKWREQRGHSESAFH